MDVVGLAAVTFIFGGPVIGIVLNHQRKMTEMKVKLREQADQNVLAEIRELKDQMVELRDTTTRYDMSFDTALQRLESRMANVEQRVSSVEREVQSVQTQRN